MTGRAGPRVAGLDEFGAPEVPAAAARFDHDPDLADAAPASVAEFDATAPADAAPVAMFGSHGARAEGSSPADRTSADGGPAAPVAPVADLASAGGPPGDQGSTVLTARLDGGRRNGGGQHVGGSRRRPLLVVQPQSNPEESEYRPEDQQRRRSSRPGAERPRPDPDADDRATPPSRRPFGPKQIDPDADPVAAAREICLRLLTDRARTRQELAQAMRRRGVPDEAASSVLERFDEVGLIDDAAFAAQFVRSRHNHKGLARRAIAMELQRKGVDGEVAEEALGEVDAASESRRARELVDRKLRSLTVTTPDQRMVATRRLVGMLARKGYGAGTAYGVVREALAAHGADPDELGADPPED